MPSEDELGEKLDRCLANAAFKTVAGVALGVVTSVVLFRRRPWPVWLGLGAGLGMGYADCSHDLRSPYLLKGKLVKVPNAAAQQQQSAAAGVADNFVIVDRGAE